MAVLSGTAVAKIAATVLSNDRLRKTAGWIVVGIFSPLIVVAVMVCGILSGASNHNQAVVDYCFYGGASSDSIPLEYQTHIENMQHCFSVIDQAVADINTMVSGTGLDGTQVKAVFYTLYFDDDTLPSDGKTKDFVDAFVRYEEVDEVVDGIIVGSYTVAYVLELGEVYQAFTPAVTQQQQENIADLYAQIASGGDSFSGDMQYGTGSDTTIDISGFTNTATKNNLDLATYAVQAWENQWGYVWGTFGGLLTPSLLESKVIQYPDGVGSYQNFILEHWLGGRTTDCVGLIKGYGWLDCDALEIGYGTNGMPDIGADQMYQSATVKGSISTIPEVVGLAVWKDGHIGVYVGDGYVIEAMGTRYGVVKTKLEDRSWTAWLEIPYIEYESEDDT